MADAPLSLLLVEDQLVIRVVARGLLAALGHRVAEAPDGETAVALAADAAFDAILMDISMPGMGGVAAARAIRAGGGPSAAAPILAVTADAEGADRAAFAAAGIDAVFPKPVSREGWVAALRGVTPQGQAEAEPPLADRARLAQLRDDLGGAEAAGFWADFLREGERTVALLAAAPDDPAPLRPRVHRLAGSAALFGAPRLRARLAAIEAAIRGGGSAAALIAGLPALWAESVEALGG